GATSAPTPIFGGGPAGPPGRGAPGRAQGGPRLYGLALTPPQFSGIVDVTAGDNSWDTVTGYQAAKGYDLASGLGTIDATRFVHALAGR
ncbi:protease, partial [Kitasatospora indigofera]